MMLERHLRGLGWLVSLAALAGVIVWAVGQPAPRSPKLPGLIAVAVGLYAVATLVRAERWRLLLRFNGASPSRLDCHALTCIGYMGNNVLPARAGDAMRVLYMAPRSSASARSRWSPCIAVGTSSARGSSSSRCSGRRRTCAGATAPRCSA